MSNIIFDFDGTIADSLPLVMDLFYKWSKSTPYSPEEVNRLRNMTIKQILGQLDVPLWRVPALLVNERSNFGKRLREVALVPGMASTLQTIYNQGHQMFVMSSNSPENIRTFLKQHNIDGYFHGIQGNAGLFGKAPVMKSIIRKHKLDSQKCFSVGDEVRDIEAAKKAHITSVAVTWGYNGEKILEAHQPNVLVRKPVELVTIFTSAP